MNTIPFTPQIIEGMAESFAEEIREHLDQANTQIIQAHGERLGNGAFTTVAQIRQVNTAFNAFADQSTRYTRYTRYFIGFPERHNTFEARIAVLVYEQSGQVQR